MEEVSGKIEKINPKGVKIDGKWYNYSKYMQEDAPKLNEGDEIRVDVNGDWIMRFKSLSRESIREPLDTDLKEPDPSTQPESHSKEFDRQSTITRLAVLNTATEILKTHRRPIEFSDIVSLASQLEKWALGG